MKTATHVNVHEAKTQLSRLLARVAAGEEIVIARGGKPVARLVPLHPRRGTRLLGGAAGQVTIRPGFDDPLSERVQRGFES